MEAEAEKLMVEAFAKNFIDYEEYPVSSRGSSVSRISTND